MKRITIQVSDEIADRLASLASACTRQNKRRDGATTHGPLDVTALMTMLAEDAAMVITRPGSWEGSNMAQVFSSHGYEV
ncbi:MAG: hypothetical protein RBS28_10090 [Rhodocyclaceae bacterium]|jgi:hypothetical protein|nr:hypothetical protein [Rhodocyclaceae bacterium]